MLSLFLHFLAPACAFILVPAFFIPLLGGCFAPAAARRSLAQNIGHAFLIALKVGLPLALLLAAAGAWWITAHMGEPDPNTPAPVLHRLS